MEKSRKKLVKFGENSAKFWQNFGKILAKFAKFGKIHDFRFFLPSIADGRGSSTDFVLFFVLWPLSAKFPLKIAKFFLLFFSKISQILPEFCPNFAKIPPNVTNFFRDFSKMQHFLQDLIFAAKSFNFCC